MYYGCNNLLLQQRNVENVLQISINSRAAAFVWFSRFRTSLPEGGVLAEFRIPIGTLFSLDLLGDWREN